MAGFDWNMQLAEAGLSRHALDAIAVGRGPGAFTGVRLGVALAQGMGLALEAPEETADDESAAILAVIDARIGETYAACYRRDGQGGLIALDEERVCAPETLALREAPAWHVVGSGWATYADLLRRRFTGALRQADGDRYPQARHVAELAVREYRGGRAVPPEQALPMYLRDKVALTLTERAKHDGGSWIVVPRSVSAGMIRVALATVCRLMRVVRITSASGGCRARRKSASWRSAPPGCAAIDRIGACAH